MDFFAEIIKIILIKKPMDILSNYKKISLLTYLSFGVFIYGIYQMFNGPLLPSTALLVMGFVFTSVLVNRNISWLSLQSIKEHCFYYLKYHFKIPKSTKELTAVLEKYNTSFHFFNSCDFQLPLCTDNKGESVERKPVLLFKFKPREYLPWVDALYFTIIKELKEIGFRPCVYLYDFPFEIEKPKSSSAREITVSNISPGELARKLRTTTRYIKKIVGPGVKIRRVSSFFGTKRYSRLLHRFLFARAVPIFINELDSHITQQSLNDSAVLYKNYKELYYKMMGYPSMLIAESLAMERPVVMVQWKGREMKLRSIDKIKPVHILTTNTLLKSDGHVVDISGSYYMNDTEEDLVNKINTQSDFLGGLSVLQMICDLLLYNQNSSHLIWNSYVEQETDAKRIKEYIERMHRHHFFSFTKESITLFNEKIKNEDDLTSVRVAAKTLDNIQGAFLKEKFLEGVKKFQTTYQIGTNV